MAATLDGKIAKHTKHPADWTSKADKEIFVAETKKAGVIVMGKTTYETIGRPLPGRLNVVMDFKPDKTKNIPDLLEFTNKPPKSIISDLEKKGFSRIILGGGATINGLFLKRGLIDEIWLTIEPKIFGEGLSLFRGVKADFNLTHLETRQLSSNVIQVRYKVIG